MSKVVQAVNVMIEHPEKISNAISTNEGFSVFFCYDQKHVWSIVKRANFEGDDFVLSYYPNGEATQELVNLEPENWEDLTFVRYSASDIGTKEAKQSFSELFNIVQEKVFGMDEVFDEIINGDIPF